MPTPDEKERAPEMEPYQANLRRFVLAMEALSMRAGVNALPRLSIGEGPHDHHAGMIENLMGDWKDVLEAAEQVGLPGAGTALALIL